MSKNKYEKQKGSKQTDMKEMSKRFEKLSDNEKMFIAGAIAALSTRAENRRSAPGTTV